MSADMSPYCSAHDEWLSMKLCIYVGYHDANNVSNVGGDPVTQLNGMAELSDTSRWWFNCVCAVAYPRGFSGCPEPPPLRP